MKRGRSRTFIRLVLALLMLAVLAAMLPAALAATEPAVVYLGGEGAADTNAGTAESPVATLTKAYELACAVENGIAANADAEAVIVISGEVDTKNPNNSNNFNIPSSGKATNAHVGTLTVTSNYAGTDYRTTGAKLYNSRTDNYCYFQLGGPTVYRDLNIDVSGSYGLCIYAGNDFTIDTGVTTTGVTSNTKLMICSGWTRTTTSDPVSIAVNSGAIGTVSTQTNGGGHGSCTGSCTITVGGTAQVNRVLSGAIQNKNTAPTVSSVTTRVEGNAVISAYSAGGSNAKITDSTLILAGGTVNSITIPSGVTNAHLTLSGVTNSAYTLPEGTWSTFTVTDSSDVTMAAALPEGINLVVNKSSKLTLYPGDATAHTGDGTEIVVRTHEHNFVADTSKTDIPGTCTTQGTAYQKCDVSGCTETREVPSGFRHTVANGVCSVCGGSVNVVYVKDGGTGDGFTAATAVGSLEAAYGVLIANTDIENDASVKGTIVICGVIESSENFNFENDGTVSHKGTVTLTSEYNGVDYRESGAQLHLASAHTGTSSSHGTTCEQRFQVGGPTIMENLTINRAGSKQPLTIYAGTYLYIDETVQTLDTNYTYTPATPAVPALTDAEISTIKLSAHRGYQPMGPENSILSFQAAADLGFAYIETDVYRTTDGELVCIHDATLDRTTDGTGNVTQMTLAQVQSAKMDWANYGYDITKADPTKLYVPTFREYLEICKAGGCIPFIELKDTRNDVTEDIIDMALEYFDAEDIVISSGYGNLLEYAHQYNPDVFIHKIWGSEGEIATYGAMLNSKGEHYAGIAFDVQNLHLEENYEKAERLIKLANDAGLQTCLRGADTITQVRYMHKLGINYYPTNLTSPEKLQQLKTEIPGTPADYVSNGQSTKGTNDHRIFVRGGYNSGTTTEDISITLLGGQYDLAAPSNGEQASSGNYEMTVGGSAYVSRLILGETGGSVNTDRETSELTVQDDAIIANVYVAGDKANVKAVTVDIQGGWVKAILSTRSSGKAGDLAVSVADVADMPDSVTLDSSVITGDKTLSLGGTGELGDCAAWDSVTAKENAVITLTGAYAEELAKVGSGKFLLNDQSVTFGTVSAIKEDGKAVELGTDIPYTAIGTGTLATVWYADDNGVKGAALASSPSKAGTYWVGVSMAEAATDNSAVFHAAVPEQTVKFTVVHDLTEVGATAPGCTTDGVLKHYTCAGCDTIFADAEGKTVLESTVDPALEHTFTDYKSDGNATCTADGTKTAACDNGCGKTDTVTDPGTKGHKLTKVDAKAATYDAGGNIAHYACSVCGKLYNDDKAAKELTKAEVTTPKLEKPADETTAPTDETTKPTEKPVNSSPATGEGYPVALMVWVMLGALLAMAFTVKRREV